MLLEAAREGRRRVRREPHEWEFVGRRWPAAVQAREPRGWNEPSVARRYADVWGRYRAAAQSALPLSIVPEQAAGHDLAREPYDEYDITFHNVTMTFAYALARSARGHDRLAVLDWGGATGHFSILARALYPDLALDYAVKEVPETARVGRTLAPDVTFLDDDRPLERAYDLVMASNSLQYAEDWRALLARLAAASRGYVFLHQVPVVVRGGSFAVIQRPYRYGYQTEYVSWCLGRRDLLEALDGLSLRLVREFVVGFKPPVAHAPERPEYRGYLLQARGDASSADAMAPRT